MRSRCTIRTRNLISQFILVKTNTAVFFPFAHVTWQKIRIGTVSCCYFILPDVIYKYQWLSVILISTSAYDRFGWIYEFHLRTFKHPSSFSQIIIRIGAPYTRNQNNTIIPISGTTINVTLVEMIELTGPAGLEIGRLEFIGDRKNDFFRFVIIRFKSVLDVWIKCHCSVLCPSLAGYQL